MHAPISPRESRTINTWLKVVLLLCLLCVTQAFGGMQGNYPAQAPAEADRPESHDFRHVTGLTWGNGEYVAVGLSALIMTSSDGKAWTTRHWENERRLGVNTLLSVAWNGQKYLAVGVQGITLLSTDGRSWHQAFPTLLKTWRLGRVRAVNGVFYVMAQAHRPGQSSAVRSDTAVFSSPDGESWQQLKMPVGSFVDVVGKGGEVLLLSRNGTVYKSSGTGTWTEHATVNLEKKAPRTAVEMAGSGSSIVALIEVGSSAALANSTDGEHWRVRYCKGCYHVAWNGENFVASGSFGMALSNDGESWEPWSVETHSSGKREIFNKLAGHDGETLLIGGNVNPLLLSSFNKNWEIVSNDSPLPPMGEVKAFDFQPTMLHRVGGVIEKNAPTVRDTPPPAPIEGYVAIAVVLVFLALLQRAVARLYPEALLPWLIGAVNLIAVLRFVAWLSSGGNLPPFDALIVLPLGTLALLSFLVAGLVQSARRPK